MPIPSGKTKSDLLTLSPTADVGDPVTTILVTESSYSDVAIDTRWTPLQSIMSHIGGSIWEVTYFSQVIDGDTQLMPQSPTVSAVFQQYTKIEGMQLKVTDALNVQQDDVTKMMQIDGSAIVFAAIIPNEGDMFIADIGVGKPAVFRVVTSSKKAIFKEAAYDITYAFASTDEEYIHDLEGKTVKTYVFKKDFLNRGQAPLILEEEAVILEHIEDQYRNLADSYFSTFYNKEFKTLTAPGQAYTVYDPFLVKFVNEQFSQEDSHLLQDLRVLNTGNDEAVKQDNFWKALRLRDKTYLKTGFTKTGQVYTSQFENNPFYNGIRWSGIQLCTYPANPRIGIGGLKAINVLALTDLELVSETPNTFYSDMEAPTVGSDSSVNTMYPSEILAKTNIPLNTDGTLPIKKVTHDLYYVLSEDFYKNTEDKDVLEYTVLKFMERVELDAVQLSKTAKIVQNWGMLEQYYYIPVLLYMMRCHIYGYQG